MWERIAAAQRARESLPASLCVGWVLQVVDALRYMHACEILHRDIKLENIFICGRDSDSVVKLGDFGLATALDTAETQCGTPDYMAPEVLQGKSYSAQADVFSLGAVLYALVGTLPPVGQSRHTNCHS